MFNRDDLYPGRPLRWAIIAVILFVAAYLRLQQLRQPLIDNFSWRQTSTAMMADNFFRTDPNIFFPEVSWTGPGPNYQGREFQTVSYLASLLYRIFGQHDWIGRLIGIIAGTWGVFALYCLVRRVWDEDRAIVSAAFMAILPGAVFIDRSFLPDPTMLSLATTSMWMLVAHLQTQKRRFLVGFGIIGCLAMLTKLPSAAVIPAIVYGTISIPRSRGDSMRRSLLRVGAVFGIMLIPIVAYYAWAIYLGTHYPPYHIAGSGNWVTRDGFSKWIERGYYLQQAWRSMRYWMWTTPIALTAALGLLLPPRWLVHEDERVGEGAVGRAPWFFHFWALGCVVLYIIGARELTENVWNFHIFNPLAAVFCANLIVSIARAIDDERPTWVGFLASAAVVGFLFFCMREKPLRWMYHVPNAKESYRMGLALRRLSSPGDLVVTVAHDVGDPMPIYYSQRRGWVLPPAHMPKVWKPWNLFPPDNRLIIMFDDLRERGAKWVGIVNHPIDDTRDKDHPKGHNLWADRPGFTEHLKSTCTFVEKGDGYVIYRIGKDDPTTQPALK